MKHSPPDADDAEGRTNTPRRQKQTKLKNAPVKPRAKSPSTCLYENSGPVVDSDALDDSLRRDGLADQEWFDEHPRATYRVRPATQLERDAFQFEGVISVVVSVHGPGSHCRIYYTTDEWAELIKNATSRCPTVAPEAPFQPQSKRMRIVLIEEDVLN